MEPRVPMDEGPELTGSLRRWLSVGVVLLLVLVATFPVYRAVERGRRSGHASERRAAEIVLGRQLWSANCSECHGDGGEGPDAPALNARQFFESANDRLLTHVIEGGVPGTDMSAWWNEFGGPLTGQQIRAVVSFILRWKVTAPDRPDWRTPGP